MRISEIKQCFNNEKAKKCVKNDFLEDPVFLDALGKSRSQVTPENVFNVIKRVFLIEYEKEERKQAETNLITASYLKRLIKKLSKHLYGDSLYWTKGTKYEILYTTREQKKKNKLDCEFLYERYGFNRRNKYDIVKNIARSNNIRTYVLIAEEQERLKSFEDLYSAALFGILNAKENGEFISKTEFFTMCSISWFAHKDREYWLEQNGLKRENFIYESENNKEK